jgi:threonylcarbamoyladenosine tRNA methylthiotransferase MtaB
MPTFYIQQFGCRATQADGAALEYQLLQRGYTPSEKADADVVVINTCTVTAAADAQAREAIRKLNSQNPSTNVIVTGCYAQRAPEELAGLPGVAWVVGNSHKPELPLLIEKLSSVSQPKNFVPLASVVPNSSSALHTAAEILTGDIFKLGSLLSAPVLGGEGNHTRPTLKIQDGCNSRCSYCVIPFVRGRSRSLSPELVVQEITRLSDSGFREIVLSGINLGSYGRDLRPRVTFLELLRRILAETSVERLRISSIEPMDVTEDLVKFFAVSDRMARHFHMPLQSGADRVLAAMHRWYRAEQYARRALLVREYLPDAAIGADVIAGFPGESPQEHSATLAFIEQLPFTYLHVFPFSRRPGTRAAQLPGELLLADVKARARELRALGEKKSAAFRAAQIGKKMRVLTLRSNNHNHDPQTTDHLSDAPRPSGAFPACTPALSSNYLQVRIPGHMLPNQWRNVQIVSKEKNVLLAIS